jgi:hypothetical protein
LSAEAKTIVFKMLRELSPTELRALLYILREASVGEMIAIKELRLRYGIEYDEACPVVAHNREAGVYSSIVEYCFFSSSIAFGYS